MTIHFRELMALHLADDLGPVSFKILSELYGNPLEILKAARRGARRPKGVRQKAWDALKDGALFKKADLEIQKAKKSGVEILALGDKRYPRFLSEIYAPPMVLYVKGNLPSEEKPRVAVVGSRICTLQGQACARKMAYDLASRGAIVVSGMARGIDTFAHQGALEAEGLTIAVLGSGLNHLYPEENISLAKRIAENGALISEFPMDMQPLAQNFPIRNRVISGLAAAVLVVEAQKNSGALITADIALEQGREVYAMPGSAGTPLALGSNHLLKQGAKLALDADDILEDLEAARALPVSTPALHLNEEENRILSFLNEEPLHVDDVIEKTQLPAGHVISTLSVLEIKRCVKQLPGKTFIRNLSR